jgi:hypothetical protein
VFGSVRFLSLSRASAPRAQHVAATTQLAMRSVG